MRHGSITRRRGVAAAITATLVVGTVVIAQPADAATTTTVSTVPALAAELAAPADPAETVVLGADLPAAPGAAARSKDASTLTVDLAGHTAGLGSLTVGDRASLRITDSTAAGGTLTVNGLAPDGSVVETPVAVRNGTALVIDGTAHVTATGGKSSAVIGGHAAPDPYGAGEIDILGHAAVDVRGSSTAGRTSSGIGGPGTSIHIGEHAVVAVAATSSGAAIGGGSGGTAGDSTVLIDGDAVVTATTAGYGAAIGSAAGIQSNRLTTVTITDRARVTATAGPYGPGIGNGAGSGTSTIVSIGGTAVVTATGGASAAGIGGGASSPSASLGGDGAVVTIGAGATVTAAGGSASDTAIGSGTGRAAASSGSLSNAGHLTIPAGAALRIPAGATVANSGTLTTSGPISGTGTLMNSGTVATLGASGSLDPATPVTGDRWAITFDPGAGAPTGPTSLRLTADSIEAGGIAAPLPAPPMGQVVVGWNTAADGSGQDVGGATDLRTVAPASAGGAAVRLTLHAVLLARADAVPRLPEGDLDPATSGSDWSGSVRAISGSGPITYQVVAGALPVGTALDPGTGALTGTPHVVQTARFTVEAGNRFGTDSREYRLDVVAPVQAPASAPAADPSAPAADPSATAADPSATDPSTTAGAPTASSAPEQTAAAGAAGRTAEPLPQLPATLARTRLPIGAAVQQAVGVPGTVLAVTAGTLPAGLRIDAERGVVRGTPTLPGRYRFTLTAMTAAGSVQRTYSLVVVAPLSVAVVRPSTGGVPPVAGSRTTVVLRGLLPHEHWVVRWAGRVVAHGTARSSRALVHVRVPRRAGLRVLGARATDHPAAGARREVVSLPAGDVLAVAAPDGVQANRALTIRVHGLAAGEPVRVRYAGRTVSPAGAHADGAGGYRLTTSAGWSWGWKPIEVRGLPGRTGAARVAVLPRRD